MKHFHQGFAPCFLRRERGEQICMFLFEDLVLKVFAGKPGPSWQRGNSPRVRFLKQPPFFLSGVSSSPSSRRAKRGRRRGGDVGAKMEGSSPQLIRTEADIKRPGRVRLRGCWGNLSSPRKHSPLLSTYELFPFMYKE